MSRDGLEVNGKSIMGVMMLAAEEGSPPSSSRRVGADEGATAARPRSGAGWTAEFGGEP